MPGGKLGPEKIPEITDAFYKAYEKAFSRYMTDAPIQGLTWRLRAQCPLPSLEIKYSAKKEGGEAAALKGRRKAYFPEQNSFIECPVYERYLLKPGTTLKGPAILEERESTTIAGVDSELSIDDKLNIIIERKLP